MPITTMQMQDEPDEPIKGMEIATSRGLISGVFS